MFATRVLFTRASRIAMSRQQTLGNFFSYPSNMKAPLTQPSLKEMWGKKRKAKDEEAAAPESDGALRCHESTGETELKKRKVSTEDEGEEKIKVSGVVREYRSPSPDPQKTSIRTGKKKAAEISAPRPASPLSTSHASMSPPRGDPLDEGEQGMEEASEGVDEQAEDGTSSADKVSASKSAEAALSKRDDVDVSGGWEDGDPVPYAALAKTFAHIESTTKRLEKNAFLTSFLLLVIERSAPSDHKSLLEAVYLCINRLSPDYIGIELGIGESLLIKAISESTGRTLSLVKAELRKEGDLGLVAMNSKNSQKTLFRPKPLTVSFVFQNLREIALTAGNASQAKKVSIITKLLAACQELEAKYIVRSLEGKLRIGNAERSVLVAVAHAAVLAEREKSGKKWSQEKLADRLEEAAKTLKGVYSELPSYDEVIPALLQHGIDGIREHCKLTPGVPLKPMLAKPTKAIGEVLDRFENKRFTCEYKYDGERAQVHKLPDGKIAVFSRNSEDMSKKYPDLVEQLPKCIKKSTKSFVLDAEAVAIDRNTGKLMPFQELSRRKRKDVKVEDIQVRVCLFAFDLLYLNDEPLLRRPLYERRKLLREHFQVVPDEFNFAKSSDGETTEEIQSFLEESVKDGCEGLMVKMLDSEASYYEPSRRSVNWLKLKKDYLAGVGDSLDLVVVGGYHGKGKRTNVYGAYLLACYDSDSEEYQTICKIGTGFSEEMLQSHYATLKPLETERPRGDIKTGGAKPDVWFEPQVVWEVLTADLSLSPVYTAAQGLIEDRGISLRFPRFIRIRDDKAAEDSTGPEQIAEMYRRQVLSQNGGKSKKGDHDDGFW